MKKRFLFLTALFLSYHGAHANVVLEIDTSDPAAVVFRATGESAAFTGNDTFFFFGLDLENFFKAPVEASVANAVISNPSLTTGAGHSDIFFDRYTIYWASRGINFFANGETTFMPFSLSAPAFLGVNVLDLSAFAAWLPDVGAENEIYGDSYIGKFKVIPEPALSAVGAWGLGAWYLMSRRRRC